METLRAVMTVDEVAEYLRIPRASVYKLAQQGRIPCQKVGRHWRFRREAVDEWLDNAQVREGNPRGRLGVDVIPRRSAA